MNLEQLIQDVEIARGAADEAKELAKRLNADLDAKQEALFNAMQEAGLSSVKTQTGDTVIGTSRNFYSIKAASHDQCIGRLDELGFGAEIVESKRTIPGNKLGGVINSLPVAMRLQLLNDELISVHTKPIIQIRKGKNKIT